MKYDIELVIVGFSDNDRTIIRKTIKTGGLADKNRLIRELDAIYFKEIASHSAYWRAFARIESKKPETCKLFWRPYGSNSNGFWQEPMSYDMKESMKKYV